MMMVMMMILSLTGHTPLLAQAAKFETNRRTSTGSIVGGSRNGRDTARIARPVLEGEVHMYIHNALVY